jgi:2-polyprenyl-3-methyl-5-hydroxy-6-metoxy-1,4-benzoquinol methylase
MRREATWAERLLLALSRRPDTGDYSTPHDQRNLDNALSLLTVVFPEFLATICGKDILDYGCGSGLQALAMGQSGARSVFGLDTNQHAIAEALEQAKRLGLQARVEFGDSLAWLEGRRFDLVICQNSMEHFPEPAQAIESMKSVLRTGGRIMITFGPPGMHRTGVTCIFSREYRGPIFCLLREP